VGVCRSICSPGISSISLIDHNNSITPTNHSQ
jgi:hypothetical protein